MSRMTSSRPHLWPVPAQGSVCETTHVLASLSAPRRSSGLKKKKKMKKKKSPSVIEYWSGVVRRTEMANVRTCGRPRWGFFYHRHFSGGQADLLITRPCRRWRCEVIISPPCPLTCLRVRPCCDCNGIVKPSGSSQTPHVVFHLCMCLSRDVSTTPPPPPPIDTQRGRGCVETRWDDWIDNEMDSCAVFILIYFHFLPDSKKNGLAVKLKHIMLDGK